MYPQLVYDVHQQGQNNSRFIIPPFFDPPNPRVAPSILREVGLIGYKMAADLQAKNIAGVATNSTYDTWWHGGFRSAPYFHNSIGILSEAASTQLMSPVTVKKEDLAQESGDPRPDKPARDRDKLPGHMGRRLVAARGHREHRDDRIACLLQMGAKFRQRYLRNFYEYGKANLVTRRRRAASRSSSRRAAERRDGLAISRDPDGTGHRGAGDDPRALRRSIRGTRAFTNTRSAASSFSSTSRRKTTC